MQEVMNYIKQNITVIDIVIEAFTALLGLIGVFWSLLSGLKTLSNYARTQKEGQISKWISCLCEKEVIKKVSALNGLTSNCQYIFDEVFYICIEESNLMIRSALIEELAKTSNDMFDRIVEKNTLAVRNYVALRNTEKISQDDLKIVKTYYKKHSRVPNPVYTYITNNNETELFEYISLSSHLLNHALQNRKQKRFYGSIILNIDKDGSWCKNSELSMSLLQHINSHYSHYIRVEYISCRIQNSNYSGSQLKKNKYENTIIQKVTFTNAKLVLCGFYNTKIEKCSYSKG